MYFDGDRSMTIKLNGSTAGSVALDAPASTTGNADITFKLPIADGTAGQALQTDGSGNLSWVDNPAPDYVKLAAAKTTSASGAIVFMNLDVTNYRTFKIIFSGYPVTDDAFLALRVLDGSTYKTNAGTYNWTQTGTSGAGSAINNAGSDSYAKVGAGAGNNNYEGWRTEITYVPHVSGDPAYQNNFGYAITNRYNSLNHHQGEIFHFKFHQADVTDGIELYPSSGQFAAYSYTLYGLRR